MLLLSSLLISPVGFPPTFCVFILRGEYIEANPGGGLIVCVEEITQTKEKVQSRMFSGE